MRHPLRWIVRSLPLGLALSTLVSLSNPALAHRDDTFFGRRQGLAGTRVAIHKALRVVWNGYEAPPGAPYHEDRRSLTLLELDEPSRNVTVRIPDVRPGRYALLVYDGSEDGGHITWTVFRVLPRSLAATGPDRTPGLSLLVLALVGASTLIASSFVDRRRRGPASLVVEDAHRGRPLRVRSTGSE